MLILGLNVFELAIGAVFGAVPAIWIHWWALATVPACAFLWAWTGAGHGAVWRKVLMPTLVCGAIFAVRNHWQVFIGLPFMVGALSLGYGIPSTQPPDAGSPLGRFWWARTKGTTEKEHQDKAELFTRATIYAILALSFIPAFL